MDTTKQVEISRETIEVFSSFTKINTQLWITNSEKQSVLSSNSSVYFVAQIKEKFSSNLMPDWGNEKGFGIYEGDKFVDALKSLRKPVLDFSKIHSNSVLGILDKTNPKKKIEIEIVGPDEVNKKDRQVFLPPMDLEVRFTWEEINQMKKMGERIEIEKYGKDDPHFKNIEPNKGMITQNVITDYKPKGKSFRFLFFTEYLKMPKGNYKVSFSESGISEWINTTDRRFVLWMTLEKGCWYVKPKTPSQLSSYKPVMKPVKDITAKEYKSVNQYSNAVKTSWRKGVDAIIETGELLSGAKDKFSKNELVWQSFLNQLPFGIRTIDRLIYISKHKKILLDKKIYNNLPPSWGTLYEICTLGSDKPVKVYENVEGETSKTKKQGFTEITLDKKDFILKAMDTTISDDGKRVPVLRTDMTKKDIEVFKKQIDVDYFEVKKPTKELWVEQLPEPEEEKYFSIFIKPKTPKKEIDKLEDKLTKLLKGNKWFELE